MRADGDPETTSMEHRCCWGDNNVPSMLFQHGLGSRAAAATGEQGRRHGNREQNALLTGLE
jgi:hypothetical protein